MSKYYWSADGALELAQTKKIILDESGICYHCEGPMPAGSTAVEVTDIDGYIYVLHQKCAVRSIREIK